MRDFTVAIYKKILTEMRKAGYEFKTFEEYLTKSFRGEKIIILRHDVDEKAFRSLKAAKIEKHLGIRGTYFVRVRKSNITEEEIKKIAELGHEIGYHYEDLDRNNGDIEAALKSFQKNLAHLREIVPIKTICMHGSPLSKYDNRNLWHKFDYHDFGIIGEPYFDIDFSEGLYLTDTGRRWDGERVSIRDKMRGERSGYRRQKTEDRSHKTERGKEIVDEKNNETIIRPKLHSTKDIINVLRNGKMPDQLMLTIHPQRWTDEWGPWLLELVSQKIKNAIKYFIVRYRKTKVRGDE